MSNVLPVVDGFVCFFSLVKYFNSDLLDLVVLVVSFSRRKS